MILRIDRTAKTAELYADYQLRVPLALIDGLCVKATLRLRGMEVLQQSEPLLSHSGRISLRIQDAQLWWPKGYGEPVLYDAEVQILDTTGQVLASRVSRSATARKSRRLRSRAAFASSSTE